MSILVPLLRADGVVLHTVTLGRERVKAKELLDHPSFKATLAQRLPTDLEENIVRFHHFIIAARKCSNYPLSCIYNMDETPMHFELPSNRTGIQWEPNSVSKILRSRKAELHRRSCCCCLWSKGAPESHLQRHPYTRDLVVPQPLCVSSHKKGWMDEQGIGKWIRQSLSHAEHSLLVWDSF